MKEETIKSNVHLNSLLHHHPVSKYWLKPNSTWGCIMQGEGHDLVIL